MKIETIVIIATSLPLIALFYSIVIPLTLDYGYVTHTHCKVRRLFVFFLYLLLTEIHIIFFQGEKLSTLVECVDKLLAPNVGHLVFVHSPAHAISIYARQTTQRNVQKTVRQNLHIRVFIRHKQQ